MEDVKTTSGQEQTNESETVVNIGNDPVMQSAIDVLGIIGKKNHMATTSGHKTNHLFRRIF